VPDLTGYITEGQVYVDIGLNRKGLYPPINPLPSLSRLMKDTIGKGSTRSDHKYVSDQLYALYATGRDLRDLVAVVGDESLSDTDKKVLEFADLFEQKFINQGYHEDRTIFESLDIGWGMLAIFDDPHRVLKRIPSEYIDKFHMEKRDDKTPIYKSIGALLIKTKGKNDVTKELKENKDSLVLRKNTLEKQEGRTKEKLNELQSKVQNSLNLSAGSSDN